MKRPVTSRKLFARATTILPGGVDSPVRAFQAVGGTPLFVSRATGSTIRDVDGNRYIDYVMSWGPLIHGHAPSGLVKAVTTASRPVAARATRSALIAASVPELVNRTSSMDGTNSRTASAISISRRVGAPKLVPSLAARASAESRPLGAWP